MRKICERTILQNVPRDSGGCSTAVDTMRRICFASDTAEAWLAVIQQSRIPRADLDGTHRHTPNPCPHFCALTRRYLSRPSLPLVSRPALPDAVRLPRNFAKCRLAKSARPNPFVFRATNFAQDYRCTFVKCAWSPCKIFVARPSFLARCGFAKMLGHITRGPTPGQV